MKQVLGYFLGFAIFIAGIPALMWLVSGMPALTDIPVGRLYLSALVAIAGLSLSVWSIVYMKRVGKGNPFDAMGREIAPRTRHLCVLQPDTHVEVFPGMNHGQLLVDHPEEVARRIKSM